MWTYNVWNYWQSSWDHERTCQSLSQHQGSSWETEDLGPEHVVSPLGRVLLVGGIPWAFRLCVNLQTFFFFLIKWIWVDILCYLQPKRTLQFIYVLVCLPFHPFLLLSSYLYSFYPKKFLMFIYSWGKSMSRGGAEREETQNPKQAPGSKLEAQSLMWGSNPQTVRPWPEPKSDA